VRSFIQTACLALGSLVVLSACQPSANAPVEAQPPWVLTAPLEVSGQVLWRLTGSLRSRHEIPLSFRIGGEILERLVDAGDQVAAGAVLFRLDPRDVIQQRVGAEATAAGARAESVNAERERERLADMLKRHLASQQDYDRAATAARAAKESLTAAQAALKQVLNTVEYVSLIAPAAGVVLEVSGQRGQVVAAGQSLAALATDGPREVEVDVPEDRYQDLPETATAYPLGHEQPLAVTLREIAGGVDPVTRTWRARYQLVNAPAGLALGTTVTLRFAASGADGEARLRVPVGAVLERGQGAIVWRLVEGRVQPVPVTLLGLDGEYADIQTDLAPGTQVVALGANRLQPGQAVKVRQR
jgi:RND family efflux transporter MFP subunit